VIKLGRSFWWILALVLLSFLLTRLPGLANNPLFTRLFVALLLVLMVNAIWSFLSMIGLDVTRNSRSTRMNVGEIFSENFEGINRSFIPKVWLKITDQSELEVSSGSKVLSWIGGNQARSYMAYSFLEKRGWFRLGPSQIETGDLFGLFLFYKLIETRDRLLVIPYTVNIQQFPAPYGILPGGRALRQKTLEVTPYAAGVREYVHGDPLKRIHWPTSARKQKLIVKEFEKDPLAEVWIFLDARAQSHIKHEAHEMPALQDLWLIRQKQAFELPVDTEEYAITIAASITKYYIHQNREVGLVSAGQGYSILPAERGERQLGKILETLAVLRAEGDMPLWGLVSSQLAHLARGSTVVLITASAEQQLLNVVMELIQRGLKPVVILIDQVSFGGSQDPAELESKLIHHGVLTLIVREGDDIKSVLETPRVVFGEKFFSK